mgnify:CR=1 FL=1
MFVLNDIDVDKKVLAVSKIIDKSTSSETYLRQRGTLTMPTKYQIEKVSITIGFDLSDSSHRMDFAHLAMELDEYPFVFVRSEKIKSMMFTFSERDNTLSDSSLQVFMLEKISASISSTLKDFVTLNLTLIPYNIYALVDDFSFLSYNTKEDGSFELLYGVDSPSDSRIYQDFFAKRKAAVYEKVSDFISANDNADIRILAPYFTTTKPTEDIGAINVFEIAYTDASGSNPITGEGDTAESTNEDYKSFYSGINGSDDPDAYKKFMYVYWKGDVFSSNPLSENAVQSIEVVRNNNIVSQPIAGHPRPVVQYMGKREGYLSVGFISKAGEHSANGELITPYTMFRALLEKYEYNLFVESRFSAYNIFKIESVLTSIFDINGYVPSQVFLQNNSNDKVDEYKAIFVESFPMDLSRLSKGTIEKTKDNQISKQKVAEIIEYAHKRMISTGLVETTIGKMHYSTAEILWREQMNEDKEVEIVYSDFIHAAPGSKDDEYARGFYVRVLQAMKELIDLEDDFIAEETGSIHSPVNTNSTINSFIEMIPRLLGGGYTDDQDVKNKTDRLIRNIASFVAVNKEIAGFSSLEEQQEMEDIAHMSTMGEFHKFKFEAASDLRLGEALGIMDDNSYLGINDARKLTCAPFLTWKPFITQTEIEMEYLRSNEILDKYFNEIYGDGKRIEDAAKEVAQGVLNIDRGEVVEAPNMFQEGFNGVADAIGSAIDFITGGNEPAYDPNQASGVTGSATNLIEWIGERDAGATGYEALNTVFCMKTSHNLDLTKMTVAAVMAKQPEWSEWSRRNISKCHHVSHAAGKFQAMQASLQEAINSGVIKPGDLFDERTQNKFGFWAATLKNSRRSLANNFIDARNAWKAGKMSYADYSVARNKYHNSLAYEWAAIEKTNGKGAYGGQGFVKPKDMIAAMDTLPLYSQKLASDAPNVASKLSVPVELSGKVPTTDTTTQEAPATTPPVSTDKPSEQISKQDAFLAKYRGQIPSSNGSSVGATTAGISPMSTGIIASPEETPEESVVAQQLKKLGNVTEYTVFDHDINLQIQAKDGTEMFRHGFNMAFPAIKVYIVFGGSNDEFASYSPHKPNYIELNGVIDCKVVLNDTDNPVDVAYLQLANPGRVYSDEKLFWETFKPKMDFSKFNSSEEMRLLIDMMMVSPGNRIHIKSGYGNDPNKLETIFNGEITVVDDSGVLTVVAEGYGRELVMQRYGIEEKLILSSNINSGTRESIAYMLIEFDEIQDFGRRAKSLADAFVSGFFKMANGRSPIEAGGAGAYEPEARDVASGQGSDDSFTILRFGSNFWETDTLKSQPLLKNIYADEITVIDGEFQWNLFNALDINRSVKNLLVMYNHTTWDMLTAIRHRHPNTIMKPMMYENEMTLFFGIRDQCYLANGINEGVQHDAALEISKDMYEKMKYKRYKAVSQNFIVSTGINLISNGMKVSSDFPTRYNIEITNAEIMGIFTTDRFTDETYFKDSTILSMKLDDNLKPNAIRDEDLRMNGCTSYMSAVRYGTVALTDSVKEMYDGEITILGNGKMKNGDMVFLNDTNRGIIGFVEVSECKHFFGSETGFVTAFRPKMFAESKGPYFTHLGKKVRYAFTKSFAGVLEKVAANLDKSEIFSYLNMTIDQLGAVSAPVQYKWMPLHQTIANIGNNRGEDIIPAATASLITNGFAAYLSSRAITSVSEYAGRWARIGKITAGRFVGPTVRSVVNSFTSATYLKLSQGVNSMLTSIGNRGVLGSMFRILAQGAMRIFTLAIAHPVGALAVAVFSIIASHAIASLERFFLTREPVIMSPVMIFGKPYVAGINGAQSEGVLMDTIQNMINTFKSASKVFAFNYNAAGTGASTLSPFDKDYLEF